MLLQEDEVLIYQGSTQCEERKKSYSLQKEILPENQPVLWQGTLTEARACQVRCRIAMSWTFILAIP